MRGGPGCLNRISASISGASAGVRLPSGGAAAIGQRHYVADTGHRHQAPAHVIYYDWLLEHAFAFVPAQTFVGQFFASFKDYPQRQKAASFNMDEVMEKLKGPSGD